MRRGKIACAGKIVTKGGMVWVADLKTTFFPPSWCEGNRSYLSDEEIYNNLGEKWFAEYQKLLAVHVPDMFGWVGIGDYVFPLPVIQKNCPVVSGIRRPSSSHYWTRNGWSLSPVFDEEQIFIIKDVKPKWILLDRCFIIKTMWQDGNLITFIEKINPLQVAMGRESFAEKYRGIVAEHEKFVEQFEQCQEKLTNNG